jgi:HPt (histidine-containing phosphotransfer) domain-containing protein
VTPRVLDAELLAVMRSLPGRDGPHLLPELLLAFRRDEEPRLRQLADALQRRDSLLIAEVCHSLAGSCAVIGAIELKLLLSALSRAATSGQWDVASVHFEALPAARERLHAALSVHLPS